jgi:uncharacterized phage protein gp47/JayE
MSPLFSQTKERILGDLLTDIIDNTSISKTSVGSKTRAIAEACSSKMGGMYKKFDLNVAQSFLPAAEGKYLDFIGDMMGVARLGQETAQVPSSELNVRFLVDSGTFGDINGGNSITITAGTKVSTGPAGTGIVYTVPYNVILSSTASQTYVAVRAVRAGSNSNIGARQLVYHDFINYDDSAADSLKVLNDAEIIKGLDGEIDTNYRFRISQQTTAAEAANLTAVRLAILNTPGVADLVMIPWFRGIGTFDALIKAVTSTLPTGLIAAVEESVSKVAAQGIVYNVRGPKEIGFSATGTLSLRKKLSSAEETNIINAVTSNITDYVNSLDIDEDLILNELVERVMATSDQIKNIGSYTKPFDSLFVYKQTKLEDNKIRNTLIGDYNPEEDERVIVETQYAGNTPILFRVSA